MILEVSPIESKEGVPGLDTSYLDREIMASMRENSFETTAGVWHNTNPSEFLNSDNPKLLVPAWSDLIESYLNELLSRFLGKLSDKEIEKINFNVKILILKGMGIFDKKVARALIAVHDLRNDATHGLSFDLEGGTIGGLWKEFKRAGLVDLDLPPKSEPTQNFKVLMGILRVFLRSLTVNTPQVVERDLGEE